MVEINNDGFEDLIMGGVSETVRESDEQFQARVAAAQAKLQKVKKDEQKAQGFDRHLAQLIPKMGKGLLDFVILLIDKGVPSLTILAFLSLAFNEAGKVCYQEFHPYVVERADFSSVGFKNTKNEEKVSWWWTFILAADHISKTIHLGDLKNDTKTIDFISRCLSNIVRQFLSQAEETTINEQRLMQLMQEYKDLLFDESRQ